MNPQSKVLKYFLESNKSNHHYPQGVTLHLCAITPLEDDDAQFSHSGLPAQAVTPKVKSFLLVECIITRPNHMCLQPCSRRKRSACFSRQYFQRREVTSLLCIVKVFGVHLSK